MEIFEILASHAHHWALSGGYPSQASSAQIDRSAARLAKYLLFILTLWVTISAALVYIFDPTHLPSLTFKALAVVFGIGTAALAQICINPRLWVRLLLPVYLLLFAGGCTAFFSYVESFAPASAVHFWAYFSLLLGPVVLGMVAIGARKSLGRVDTLYHEHTRSLAPDEGL